MSTILNQSAYSVEYDKLISSGKHPADITVIEVESNQGILKRGTVLSHVITDAVEAAEASGDIPAIEAVEAFDGYRVLGTNKTDAKYIVSDEVDTISTDDTVPVTVYKSGNFNAPALIADADYEIPTSVYETLRDVGIFVD